jgi:hypothetical protein
MRLMKLINDELIIKFKKQKLFIIYYLLYSLVFFIKLNTDKLILKIKKPKFITILCFIASSLIFVIVYINPIAGGDNILYFLSSISQGLAAIFTLIFTITIFGAQTMKGYTSISKIMDVQTIGLMIIFAIGIILPLIQLEANYNYLPFSNIANLSLALDLFLATFCVLSIIPYSIRINRIMKYEGGISNLTEEASVAIDLGHNVTTSNKLTELIQLSKNSVYEMNWDYAFIIVEKLKFLGEGVVGKEWTISTIDIVSGLKSIILNCWDKELKVTIKAILGLKAIGLKSEEKKLDGFPCFYGRSLKNNFNVYEFIDYNDKYGDIDYNLACRNLGMECLTILQYFYILEFYTTFGKASLNKKPGKFSNDLEYFNIIGTQKDIENESYLKKIELFGFRRFSSVPQEIMKALKVIGVKASIVSIYGHGFAIASSALNALTEMGISAIDNDLSDGTVSMSSYCIYEIGKASFDNKIVNKVPKEFRLIHHVVKSLETIANHSYYKDKEKFKNSYETSLEFIWILGVYSNKYLPEYAKDMVSDFKKSNNQVIKDIFESEDIRKMLREYFKNTELIEEAKAFENIYDKSNY